MEIGYLVFLLPLADHCLVQAGVPDYLLLALGEPLRSLADLTAVSHSGKYGGVAEGN